FNRDGTVVIVNSTLAGNTTSSLEENGADVYNLADSAGQNATLFLFNSIIDAAAGSDVQNTQTDGLPAGSAVVNVDSHSLMFNPIGNSGGIVNGTPTMTTPEELNLGDLAGNGGPTKTMLPGGGGLGTDSSAIAAGDPQQALNYGLGADQRGLSRYAFTSGLA